MPLKQGCTLWPPAAHANSSARRRKIPSNPIRHLGSHSSTMWSTLVSFGPENLCLNRLTRSFSRTATHALGSVLFGNPKGSEFDIIRDRDFSVAISDPAPFHALLLVASIYLDHLRGLPPQGDRSAWHRLEAVRLINQRLGDPAERSREGTLHAVALMASVERLWGTGHEVHVAGLHQLVVEMGGLAALRSFPRLECTLFAFGLTTPGIAQLGNLVFSGSRQRGLSPAQEREMLASEFWSFFADVVVHSVSSPHLLGSCAQVVKPGSAMYNLLTAPTWHATPLHPPHSVSIHERIRLNTLIYLHCTLLQAQGAADLKENVKHLWWLLRRERIWKGSLRMLQYLLVKEEMSVRLRDPDLAWKSLRLLSVAEWLSPSSFNNLKIYLLNLLSGGDQGTALDLDQVRDEIFPLQPST